MPHWPPSLPCRCSSISTSMPKPLVSGPLSCLSVARLPRASLFSFSLSAAVRSVARFRSIGGQNDDFEEVEYTDALSSINLAFASSVFSSSTMVGTLATEAESDLLCSEALSLAAAWRRSGFSTSTSSASRYHLRLLVHLPQPSTARRPLFHCEWLAHKLNLAAGAHTLVS